METVRDLLVRIRLDVQKSAELQNSVKAAAAEQMKITAQLERDKIRNAQYATNLSNKERRVEEAHIIKINRMKTEGEERVNALVAKRRREEALHRYELADKFGPKNIGGSSGGIAPGSNWGTFRGEGVKGMLESGLGDRGKLLGFGGIMGVGFMMALGPALKGLTADMRGGSSARGGGLLSGISKSVWEGAGGMIGDISAMRSGNDSVMAQKVRDSIFAAIAEQPFDVQGNSSLIRSMSRQRGSGLGGLEEAGTWKTSNLLAAKELEMNSIKRAIERREKLVEMEDRMIDTLKRRRDAEIESQRAAKLQFGAMTAMEQEQAKAIAGKVGPNGDLSKLNPAEIQFARQQQSFAPFFESAFLKNAEQGGFGQFLKSLGRDKTVEDANKGINDLERMKERKLAADLRINPELNANLTIDPRLAAEQLAEQIKPLIEELAIASQKQIKDDIERLKLGLAAGQNVQAGF